MSYLNGVCIPINYASPSPLLFCKVVVVVYMPMNYFLHPSLLLLNVIGHTNPLFVTVCSFPLIDCCASCLLSKLKGMLIYSFYLKFKKDQVFNAQLSNIYANHVF